MSNFRDTKPHCNNMEFKNSWYITALLGVNFLNT